jgi:hypothetical protein
LAKHKEIEIFAAILIVHLDLHLAFNEVGTTLVAFISPVAVHKRKKVARRKHCILVLKVQRTTVSQYSEETLHRQRQIFDRKSRLGFIVDEY